MGVKIQYNPSTGKVSYNPVTGKVQVVEVFDWDSKIPGNICGCFGVDGTPRFYTLIFTDILDCPSRDGSIVNGTWKLEWLFGCSWALGGGPDDVQAVISLEASSTDIGGFRTNKLSFSGVFLPGSCDICGEGANVRTVGTCGGFGYGYDGNVKWHPFWYESWEEGIVYEVGFGISHENEFYICIQDHTSCSIGCPDPDEPGNGDDWETYWEVSTLEC